MTAACVCPTCHLPLDFHETLGCEPRDPRPPAAPPPGWSLGGVPHDVPPQLRVVCTGGAAQAPAHPQQELARFVVIPDGKGGVKLAQMGSPQKDADGLRIRRVVTEASPSGEKLAPYCKRCKRIPGKRNLEKLTAQIVQAQSAAPGRCVVLDLASGTTTF